MSKRILPNISGEIPHQLQYIINYTVKETRWLKHLCSTFSSVQKYYSSKCCCPCIRDTSQFHGTNQYMCFHSTWDITFWLTQSYLLCQNSHTFCTCSITIDLVHWGNYR